MSKAPAGPIDRLMQAISLMSCVTNDRNNFRPTGLKALEGVEVLMFEAFTLLSQENKRTDQDFVDNDIEF